MADFWNTAWVTRPMFAPLQGVGARLPEIGWPDVTLLNGLAQEAGRVVNARGQQVRLVAQEPGVPVSGAGFEERAYLRGEVLLRPLDWHDLFNALAWMTFPTAKAVINARHFEGLEANRTRRTPERDALTLFDEDGIVVLASDPQLLELIRDFRWRELFRERREAARAAMRFVPFGHALYHKALDPFVGMTAKGILLQVPPASLEGPLQAQIPEIDRLLALHLWNRENLRQGRDLAPVPVLGVPGWWPDNEHPGFYDNAAYFRPGRRAGDDQALSPSI
jgi:hypothetical protein